MPIVIFPTSGTAESPCFAGMILVVASRAMSTAWSASVLTVCTIGSPVGGGLVVGGPQRKPAGLQCAMQHKVRVYAAVHKSGWESPKLGKNEANRPHRELA